MTDLELLDIDPMTLNGDMLTKWEHAQKKAMRVNRVYKEQLKEKVEQSELETRDFQSKRNIKVANLENMQATIKMEDLYDSYQLALEKASARMKSIDSQFKAQDIPNANIDRSIDLEEDDRVNSVLNELAV